MHSRSNGINCNPLGRILSGASRGHGCFLSPERQVFGVITFGNTCRPAIAWRMRRECLPHAFSCVGSHCSAVSTSCFQCWVLSRPASWNLWDTTTWGACWILLRQKFTLCLRPLNWTATRLIILRLFDRVSNYFLQFLQSVVIFATTRYTPICPTSKVCNVIAALLSKWDLCGHLRILDWLLLYYLSIWIVNRELRDAMAMILLLG